MREGYLTDDHDGDPTRESRRESLVEEEGGVTRRREESYRVSGANKGIDVYCKGCAFLDLFLWFLCTRHREDLVLLWFRVDGIGG
jgi:hypothetical protein